MDAFKSFYSKYISIYKRDSSYILVASRLAGLVCLNKIDMLLIIEKEWNVSSGSMIRKRKYHISCTGMSTTCMEEGDHKTLRKMP